MLFDEHHYLFHKLSYFLHECNIFYMNKHFISNLKVTAINI